MKQAKVLCIVVLLIAALILGACNSGSAKPSALPSPSAPPAPTGGAAQGNGTEGTGNTDDTADQPEEAEQADAEPVGGKNGRLYDPSIYVIQASGTWRQELAEGYYADYECELYVDKVDSNDNRSSDGVYTGFFWMNMKLDTAEFINEMLKDVPVEMQFTGGGEGICDNLGFSLRTRDTLEQSSYAIPLEGDQKQEGGLDVLMDSGSFIVVAKDAYINAHATGAQGESVDYQNSKSADVELNYIVHMQPDSSENGDERKVTIYLNDGQGMSTVLNGVMRRLPGYPDDVAKYTQDAPYQEALNKHLEQ